MQNLLKAKSEFRQKGVVLKADKQKQGSGGSWNFAGEDNFLKTIQAPLSECGLEYVATLEAMPELNINMVSAKLYHIESGEFIESKKILETPVPKKDRNGNPLYLDAEIESGKQFGYWSRTLGIRLLGLSDIDPEDVQNVPEQILRTYLTASKATKQDKLQYKIEYMERAAVYGLEKDMITDYLQWLGVDTEDANAVHNTLVKFLKSEEYLGEQIGTYIEYKRKHQ